MSHVRIMCERVWARTSGANLRIWLRFVGATRCLTLASRASIVFPVRPDMRAPCPGAATRRGVPHHIYIYIYICHDPLAEGRPRLRD